METKTESSMIMIQNQLQEQSRLITSLQSSLLEITRGQQAQITLLQNQLQEQYKLITSLQCSLETHREKKLITDIEIDMLLSDDWLSDSNKNDSKTSSDSDIDELLGIKPQECKEETVLQEEKTGFLPKVIRKKTNHHPILTTGPVRIIQYTEKAFVVVGDTKKHHTKLKSMGGKWNVSLTYKETCEKFMGWVFSNTRKDKIRAWIETGCL